MIYGLLCRGAEVYRRVHIVTDGMIPDSYRLRLFATPKYCRFLGTARRFRDADSRVEYFRLVGQECHTLPLPN